MQLILLLIAAITIVDAQFGSMKQPSAEAVEAYELAAAECLQQLATDVSRGRLDQITMFVKFGFCEDEVAADFETLYRTDDTFANFINQRTVNFITCVKSHYPRQPVTAANVVKTFESCFKSLATTVHSNPPFPPAKKSTTPAPAPAGAQN